MKKFYLAVLSSVAASAMGVAAQGVIITEYTFENYPGTTNTTGASYIDPFAPEVNTATVGTFSFSGVHALATSVYSQPAGNGSARSFSSNGWATGDYYQFEAGAGFAGEQLEFDQTSSGTGPLVFNLTYSLNGGTFTNAGTYNLSAGASFSGGTPLTNSPPRFLFDLSAVSGIDTATSVTFRFVDAQTAATPSGGTSRIDNVTVGTNLTPPTVPEPTTLGLAAVTAAGLLGRRRRTA